MNTDTSVSQEWEASFVKCDLCGYEFACARPAGLIKIECPKCENMVNFENIKQKDV